MVPVEFNYRILNYRDDPVGKLKPIRNHLCDLLSIRRPVPLKVRANSFSLDVYLPDTALSLFTVFYVLLLL